MCSAEMRSVTSITSEKQASKEDSSQMPASPAAKIIRIEELPETMEQTSKQYVPSFFCLILTCFSIFISAHIKDKILSTTTCVPWVLFLRVLLESKQLKQLPQAANHPSLSVHPLLTIGELPLPPCSSFQLEAELRKIGNQPEAVYRYLRVSRNLTGCLHLGCT